jgi:hydrogenase maturation protease
VTRILVAGIGNLFFGDDAFGTEVARRLAADPPDGARVTDFGIRTIHLAYELLQPLDLCVMVDCMSRGGTPGTLYVIEPELPDALPGISADAHSMSVPLVLSAVRDLGGQLPRTLIVGCEPVSTEPGIGLSAEVARAVPGAIDLIRDLVASSQEGTP